MKHIIIKAGFILLIIASVSAGSWYFYQHRWEESTDDAAIAGRVIRISAKVSGYVKALNINDNQMVQAGDVLLEIDPADYIIRRDKAKAVYDAARAAALSAQNSMETTNISAPSNIDSASAQVASAQANWLKARKDLDRMQQLTSEARSQGQLDQAIALERSAQSSLAEAQAKLRSAQTAPKQMAAAKATKDQLAAQFKQAEADLAQAEKDLANTRVIAPSAGKITNRGVEQGNYVQIGQQLSSLLARDSWVVANFKETQLRYMRIGQPVKLTVDAFPDHVLEGKIDSIQSGTGAYFSAFPPQNATGNYVKVVQRVPVKIVFQQALGADLAIGPGMSVEPIVDTSKH